MRTGRRLAALLALPLLLAGCTGDPAPDDTKDGGPSDSATTEIDAGRFAPWTLSDYWVFDMDIRGYSRFDDVKLVYYSEDGPEYTVGTPGYDEALYHAVFNVNPILGRVHKDLLSPHENGVHAFMFPFHKDPVITDGEQWTTTFYEHALTMTADYDIDIPTPLGARPGFRISGDDPNSGFSVAYTYVRAVKWFTDLRVVDDQGQMFHLALTGVGTGYSGPAHFVRGKDYLRETLSSDGAFLSTEKTFTVSQKDVDDDRVESFAVSADIEMASGLTATLRLHDPDDEVIWQRDFDDPQSGEFNIVEIWPTGAKSSLPLGSRPQWESGTYTLEFQFSGQATADVNIVGTQDVSGRV